MSDLRYPRVQSPLSGRATAADPIKVNSNSIDSSLLAATGVTPGVYNMVTVGVDGRITFGELVAASGAPTRRETLAHTGATVSVTGISLTSSVVLHYRNGILQSSSSYTVSANTITPLVGGAYDEDDLITVFWP